MMDLNQIEQWFPEEQRHRGIDMLREYLQYEVLRILFDSKYGHLFTFLGGTCLRIAYSTDRFSEDLDFDNEGLKTEDFEACMLIIQRGLELLGYTVKIRFAYKGAYHCKITFPSLLYHYELSPHKEAKLMIKLDTEKQHFSYERKLVTLNKFGVDSEILVTPLPLLASQKVAAIMGRKRPKGRDFYDLHWILQQGTRPDYDYLNNRFEVTNPRMLRQLVASRIENFDFSQLAEDVRFFLFQAEDAENVRNFPTFWQTVRL